jgi:sugar porter (SP) family MFS transporter
MLGTNAERGLGLIYGGRVLAGIGVGGASNLSPIYCSEIAPPAIRGRLVGLYEMAWQIGGLVGFWINYGVSETMAPSHTQWLIPFAVQLIPAGMLLAGAFLIKESPRWLFSRGRREQGIKNLCWIRKLPEDHIYMQEEIYAIDAAIEEQKSTIGMSFWGPFKAVINNRRVTYRFLLGGSLFLWQNATGINAINYYSPTVFKSIGIQGTNTSLLTTGIFGVIKTTITFLWLFYLIDNFGRRSLLMWGAIAGSICMWYIGGYIAVSDPASAPAGASLSSGGISAMVFFYLWTAVYTPSWNGTPWVLNSEIFDQSVRTLAQAFAAANNWFWVSLLSGNTESKTLLTLHQNFIIARFTPQMFDTMYYGVYMFFASLMICSAIFVFFLVPETKGIPLEKMDRLFAPGLSARKAHKVVLAETHIEDQDFRRNSLRGEEDKTEESQGYLVDEKRIERV